VSPGPANGGLMGIRHAIQAQSVRLSPAPPRPGRRSDDGQTILLPVWQDQKSFAEQALPLTARSLLPAYCQENSNPCPSPRFPMTAADGNREFCPAEDHATATTAAPQPPAIRTELIFQTTSPRFRCMAQEASGCHQRPASPADQRPSSVSGFTGSPASSFLIAAGLRILHF
jgi:hypothetical protein